MRGEHRRWLSGGGRTVKALAVLGTLSLLAGFAAVPAQATVGFDAGLTPGAVVNRALLADAERPLPETLSADLLTTPQINGVVWSTAVNGNIAYAVGSFTKARPSGVPAGGVGEIVRNNAMAFEISTGNILPWNPNLNAQALEVELSPDRAEVIVGGSFTTVGGQPRSKLAVFNTSTGALKPFNTSIGGSVQTVYATASTLYVGGSFGKAGNQTRYNAAAYNRASGALLPWAPKTDDIVHGIVAAADNSRVVIAGRFQSLNDARKIGVGAVDGVTGASQQWISTPIPETEMQGPTKNTSWVTQMIEKDGVIYASANGMGGHWYDGRFAADFKTGELVWMDNCYGATTDVAVMGEVLYSVSHAHDCSSLGEFPETSPQTWRRSLAETIYATGTDQAPRGSNSTYSGQPVPSLLHWYPSINTGFFTGQYQGGWALDNNENYLVEGGEFTTVNGKQQQGLAVFGQRSVAPNKTGPVYSAAVKPSALSIVPGTVRVAWPNTWDYDDGVLTYEVLRDNSLVAIGSVQAKSLWWKTQALGFSDTGRTPGASHTYRIRVKDPAGNEFLSPKSDPVTVTKTSPSAYAEMIRGDGAQLYYPLDEASGNVAFNHVGYDDGDLGTGISRGAEGALAGNPASKFDGSAAASIANRALTPATDTFTTEAWFQTTSTSGGKILSFGNQRTGNSSNHDRSIYMDNSGRIWFGVYPGRTATLNTAKSYNDGKWHHVAATMGSAGMALYIDGVRTAVRTDVTTGQEYEGYWRVGGDNLGGWPSQPSNSNFTGNIDEVAVYPSALSAQRVADHYAASGRSPSIPAAPTDTYGKIVYNDSPVIFWRLNDGGSTSALDTGPFMNDALVTGGVVRNSAGGVTGSGTFSFNGSDGMAAAGAPMDGPAVYTQEAWFKTSTTRGGKIIGFGNSNNGLSGSYDRHVYMRDDGKLTFGTYTGTENTIITEGAYNNNQWHHVAATQSADGMKLYVDGVLSGTNPQTAAQEYTGYWRIGGDRTWGGASSPYFEGQIDEAAVYAQALSPERINAHYAAAGGVVNQAPIAKVEATVDGQNVVLSGQGSSDPDGLIVSYKWDLGDGITGEGDRIQHMYTEPGDHTVTLTVTDNNGAQTSATATVSTQTSNILPEAVFTAENAGLAVSFDAAGTKDEDGRITDYEWDFGDSSSGTGVSPSHSYARGGSYTVRLVATDDRGGQSIVTQVVTVSNLPPTAGFQSSSAGLDASFDAAASNDVDGDISSYAWDYGDGATGTGATARHSYANPGAYTVKLTVTDNSGATGTATSDIVVDRINVSPVAAFSTQVRDLTVSFDAGESVDPDGSISSYSWSFGDGTTDTGIRPTHTYSTAGDYEVTLTVVDNRGASSTATVTASPQNPAPAGPSAAFTSTVSAFRVTFDGTAARPGSGSITSYAWDFGDGTTGSGVNPVHTYTRGGQYTVTLTVTDSGNLTASVSQSVAVENPGPAAAFTSGATGRSAVFTAEDAGAGAIYAWDFGDGTTGTGIKPTHLYGLDGDYTVQLTVTSSDGSTASVNQQIRVTNAAPAAVFTSSATGLIVAFDASGSTDVEADPAGYSWSFGDGTSGTGETIGHAYPRAGTYNVSLTVTDTDGATGIRTSQVTVSPAAPAAYAQDVFGRSSASGWQSADLGGAYSYAGAAANFSVVDGMGRQRLASATLGVTAYLSAVTAVDTEVQVDMGLDKAATGGGTYQSVYARELPGKGSYSAKVRYMANGTVGVSLNRGDAYLVPQTTISGLVYRPGDMLTVRIQVVGTSPTTIRAKVWKMGQPEPVQWQLTAADSTAALQAPGRIGIGSYLSGSSTNAPVGAFWDNLWAGLPRP
ncbi:PKD domain-containing protein [Arthrobacter sp. UYP6]|uniref:PKD domain-containing protein n=1 Tax=Arthrobacter sp. UYP6 TaxID=1756378 RepID=UPI003391DFD7